MDNSEKNTEPVINNNVDVFGDCDSNRLEKNTHTPSSESSDSNSSSSEEDEPPPKRRRHSRSSDSCQEIDRSAGLGAVRDVPRAGRGAVLVPWWRAWMAHATAPPHAPLDDDRDCLGGVVASTYDCTSGGPRFEFWVRLSLGIESFC
ncbi:unnamed protein product, partial [Brenthis ino]